MKTASYVILNMSGSLEMKLQQIAAECNVSIEIEPPNTNGYKYCIAQGSLLALLQFSNATGYNNIRLICKTVN